MRMSAQAARLDTRDELVMQNVALVKSLAQRLAQRLPSQVQVEDLVSAGVLGLIEAAGR
jgi:RNA polymerase sigma factor for flagellar operon FliA